MYALITLFALMLLIGVIWFPLRIHANPINERENISIHKIADLNRRAIPKNSSTDNTIILNAAEVNKAYRWVNSSGAVNPTLQIHSNQEYFIRTDNPTDEQHQLIIEKINGNNIIEIGEGDDLLPQKSGELILKTSLTGELNYHCRYHPEYMNGTINVAS